MIEYNKRLVEVDEVLSHLAEGDLLKIPKDIRQSIKDKMDKEYIWKFDETKPLKDQNLSRDTIAILSYINMEYLLNDEQKELMKKIHELNDEKQRQEEKISEDKVGVEGLFRENDKQYNYQQEEVKDVASLIPNKDSFFTKFVNKLKELFKIN